MRSSWNDGIAGTKKIGDHRTRTHHDFQWWSRLEPASNLKNILVDANAFNLAKCASVVVVHVTLNTGR